MFFPIYKYWDMLTGIVRNFASLIQNNEDISYCTNQIQKSKVISIIRSINNCYKLSK